MGNQRNNNYDDRAAARKAEQNKQLAIVQPPRLPYVEEAAIEGVSAGQWKSLVDAVFPSAKSVDGVLLAINYCKSRGLDIFKRPVHVVPMYSSALGREVETVWPGISELRTTASRTGSWAGNDECAFGPTVERAFEDTRETTGRNDQKYVNRESCPKFPFPEWAQMTVYRLIAGQRVPFVGPKIRFVEAFSGTKGLRVPNTRWQQSPFQMLEKCAEAAALRRAFPEEMGNDLTAEEMEGKIIADTGGRMIEHRPVMDGGEAAAPKKPTREDFDRDAGDQDGAAGETGAAPDAEKPWGEKIHADLEWMKSAAAATKSLKALKDARDQQIFASEDDGWPQDALSEVARIFDARIAEIEAPAAGEKNELPLEGGNAGTPDATDPPANEERDEQKVD